MSLANVPSTVEVMGWDPQSLADYMRKLRLSGCDRVVMKGSITGVQFMVSVCSFCFYYFVTLRFSDCHNIRIPAIQHMMEHELEVFPTLYVPIITKIQSEINKGKQKRTFGFTSKEQTYPKQVFGQEEDVWDSDQFENDSDSDYESPDHETGKEDHICNLAEPQTSEQLCSGETYDCTSYKQPAGKDAMKPPRPQRMASPNHHTDGQTSLHIDKSKKPGQPVASKRDTKLSPQEGSIVKGLDRSKHKLPQQRAPKLPDMLNRTLFKILPVPPVPTQPAIWNNSIRGPSQGLDPSWYGGKLTRHTAEVTLREVNKDGAFMVRDSSKCSAEHPYTLMLLNQGKVYNIKIHKQGHSYSLGNGIHNSKSFPGVEEMITHHTYTPFLLIDATDRSCGEPFQCCLLHPVGL
ncbi:lymphocyte cytosolic protein 2 isoform X1 [Brachyistius frenatus]|uniref:lymphocyte cytosolic protein 2 isoform X1 n=1 Tax=Brachyistius frenatus TaxID=100188 RepID=UPI0037E833E8